MPKVISINGVIGWDVMATDIRNELKDVSGDVVFEIGSPGGYVYEGLEIFNLIRNYDGGETTTRLVGIGASMASYLMLAGDKKEAHDNAVFMIHNAMTFAFGNQNDLREVADYTERLSNHLA